MQRLLNAKRDAGLSPRMVQYIRAVLRRALNQALRWGLVGRNAAALASPPKMERFEIRPWTPEQARAFLRLVADDRLEALYLLALATGARQGVLLALRWRDLDLSAGVVHIRGTLQRIDGEFRVCDPKTEKARRSVGLPPSIVAALQSHRVRQFEERLRAGDEWEDTEHVFATPRGAPLSRSTVSHQFKRLSRRAGLPDQRFHDLRHCAASYLLALGEPARVVMEILGHSTVNLTLNTYSHVVPELQRGATDKLGALLVTSG